VFRRRGGFAVSLGHDRGLGFGIMAVKQVAVEDVGDQRAHEEHAQEQRKLVCYDCGVACDLSAMRTQREDFLIKLRADKPRVREPKPVVPHVPKKKRGPPPLIVQGEARKYRFMFTKLGSSAYLSHLDLIRALPRAFCTSSNCRLRGVYA